MKYGRMEYECPSPYNNKVYVGNWFEDRCQYHKETHNHISCYMADYVPKPSSKDEPEVMWDAIFTGEGCGARILFDHDGDHYMHNMSTTNDLTYNHIPTWYKDYQKRHWRFRMDRWEPEQDYARNYGNITKYGITEYKKYLWDKAKQDPRTTATTNYQDSFLPPKLEDMKFRRWGIPRSNSSILNKVTLDTLSLKLRDIPINCAPPNEELVVVPREPRCNPITWNCPDPDPLIPKRCYNPNFK
ncbi:hypothetical protein MML48_5g00019629 [Holotrichia oblita]|uniref:Uncharacterized protein n=1 Tax=Holotrichia oblita TaxID=644536 RepID=A0ACB9T3G7_HOLOL|nr:hypothetical protein MML48_5g00019629 [Holotrichia oblita]